MTRERADQITRAAFNSVPRGHTADYGKIVSDAILSACEEERIAERRRCAEIARRMYSGPGPHAISEFTSGQQQAARDIAAEIEREAT